LRAAAQGYYAPPLAAALDGFASGNIANLPEAIQGVTKLGHTSGWDSLTGIVIVLRSYSKRMQTHSGVA